MPKIIYADAETYYDKDYSLRKMTPAEYILDDRYECFGWAVAEDDGQSRWMNPVQFENYLKTLPEKVIFVSHNALFDMFLLAHRFNYVPHKMVCTLSMSRAMLYAKTGSVSLSAVAKHLDLPCKGDTIHKVSGMRWRDICEAGLALDFVSYATTDADLCRMIFKELLRRGYPAAELEIMDSVIRACVCPQYQLCEETLNAHLFDVLEAKANLLQRVNVTDPGELRSDDKFADILRTFGVEPPTKISLVTGKEKYAFAKTDAEFLDLEEHDNPDVQALVAARLGVKSTIEESRTQRFIALARLVYRHVMYLSPMPIPLRYSGAHTHRLSGDWKLNLQNLRRGGKLRMSIKARKGYKVVTADEAQVEARLVAWFCGQRDLVEKFARGEDVYSSFATSVYGYSVSKANKSERFIGKTSILGLGFGMGKDKFLDTVLTQSRLQNINVQIDLNESTRVVNLYRNSYRAIPAMWRYLNDVIIPMLARGDDGQFGPNGCIRVENGTLLLPNGMRLFYHDLENIHGEWWFKYGREKKKLFGGKLLENIIQALARIIVMDAGQRVRVRTGMCWAIQVHDELGYHVPEASAEKFKQYLIKELKTPPAWGPDIPLDAEGGIGDNFGDAK